MRQIYKQIEKNDLTLEMLQDTINSFIDKQQAIITLLENGKATIKDHKKYFKLEKDIVLLREYVANSYKGN